MGGGGGGLGGGGVGGWGGVLGGIAVQKREIDYIKIKIVPFIITLDIHRFKSENGAPVSEEFALFNWRSVVYIRFNI